MSKNGAFFSCFGSIEMPARAVNIGPGGQDPDDVSVVKDQS